MTVPFESSLMSRLLRVAGILNIIGAVLLALTSMVMANSSIGVVGAIGSLLGGAIGCLLFFSIAKIMDHVEAIHGAVIVAPKAE